MLYQYVKDDFDGVARFVDDKMAAGGSFWLFRWPGGAVGALWVLFVLVGGGGKTEL